MQISDNGIAFIARHEGFIDHAYRDAVGVLTIGYGFTMRSGVFSRYWRTSRGHDLMSGEILPRSEANVILKMLLDQEYTPSIDKLCKPTTQAQYDACASVSYNAGPGSLHDGWAEALAAGDVALAASRLRVYKLTGGILKSRRMDEAELLESGVYGVALHQDVMKVQTQLKKLGLYTGAIDGIAGHATKAAIMEFQKSRGLTIDGIAGPVTQSALDKAVGNEPSSVNATNPPVSQTGSTAGQQEPNQEISGWGLFFQWIGSFFKRKSNV